MKSDFVDDADEAIMKDVLGSEEEGPEGFYRFWSYKRLQLDGDFTLPELEKLVEAMRRMKQRHEEP